MKYLAILLSFIVVSIIILSACCLVQSSTFDHKHKSPCIGSCMVTSNTIYFAQLNYSDFNKLLFVFLVPLASVIVTYTYFYSFVKKSKQNDFKILFYLNKHIQAGLLHPKVY
jgi:hypothetical protein